MRKVTETQAMDAIRKLNSVKLVVESGGALEVLEQYVYNKLDNAKLLAESNAKIAFLEKEVLKAKYGNLIE